MGVLAAKLKNMSHLDPASFFEALFWPMNTVIACSGITEIHRGNGAEIRPVAAPTVFVACVGSADKTVELCSCCVSELVERGPPAARPSEEVI